MFAGTCCVYTPLGDHVMVLSAQVLAVGSGAEEAPHPGGSQQGAGDLGGVSRSRSSERHQRRLQELRQNHAERQRSRTIRFRRRSGLLNIPCLIYSISHHAVLSPNTVFNLFISLFSFI